MAVAAQIVRGVEATLVLSSCSEVAAAAIARSSLNFNLNKQLVGLHSAPSASCSTSSSSCYSSSCCISRQRNYGPSSTRLHHSHKRSASSVIKAGRKRNGRFASKRAPETASPRRKVKEDSVGSVALRDPESATGGARASSSSDKRNLGGGSTIPIPSPSVRSNLIGGLIALRAPEPATLPADDLNPSVAAAVEVKPTPAEASEEAIEDICTTGTLSKTSSSLIRVQEGRLFGPSIFNASKLRVLLLGKHDDERPLHHPRIYTLTHNDLTAMITLAVAREINKAQVMGWYSQLQRDEVVAEWRRTQGEMSLHVHCHISGNNFLHRLIAKLRFYIFQKELPLVLEAFMHGDGDLFKKHPELQDAPVWVYFHSNVEDYNRVECWGPLVNVAKRALQIQPGRSIVDVSKVVGETEQQFPGAAACQVPCECCSRHETVVPIPDSLNRHLQQTQSHQQSLRKVASQSSSLKLC